MLEIEARTEPPVEPEKGLYVQCAFMLATFSIGMFDKDNNVQTLNQPLILTA